MGGFGMGSGLLQGYGAARDPAPAGCMGMQQPASMQRGVFPQSMGGAAAGTMPGSMGGEDVGSVVAVNGPVRPWGKRAKDLPPTRHTPSTFQKARHGNAAGAMGVR